MAIKWSFSKKAEAEAEAKPDNGETPEAAAEDSATSLEITERKPTVIVGHGFARGLWEARLKSASLEFAIAGELDEATLAKTEFETIIETDWRPTGAASPEKSPALVEGGLVFLPIYTLSPTLMASGIGAMAPNAVGYTVFPAPNEKMEDSPIIEMARALQTTDETWEKALGFAGEAGWMPEIVGDAPGGVFIRTLACLINEAASALSDNIADVRDLDAAMQLGVGYPKGLLAWGDELGIDLIIEVLQGLMDHYEEDRYRPVPLLNHLLAAEKKFYDLAGPEREEE